MKLQSFGIIQRRGVSRACSSDQDRRSSDHHAGTGNVSSVGGRGKLVSEVDKPQVRGLHR